MWTGESIVKISKDSYETFRAIVLDWSGIDLGDDREFFVHTRLASFFKHSDMNDLDDVLANIKNNKLRATEREEIINAMTTNESFFFRDQRPFDIVQYSLLPEIIERKKESGDKTLKIWSAACSTGQEIYSLAMLIAESFPEIANWKIIFFATDINEEVIQYAKEGVYNQFEVGRGLGKKYLDRYFEKQEDGKWQIARKLVQQIEFKQFNLKNSFSSIPYDQFDIVFLRNVLIYFQKDLKEHILNSLYKLMAPTSYLFLGGSETIQNLDVELKLAFDKNGGTYFRKNGLRLLVVDDEKEIAYNIRDLLTDAFGDQARVDCCHDGQSAIEKFAKVPYDLVITDHHMPGLTGTEMIKVMFEQSPNSKNTPFLIVSSYIEEFKSSAPYVQNVQFIDKPYRSEQVIRNCKLFLKKFSKTA
jgi:chemotaxis protein methyltransferase CheR